MSEARHCYEIRPRKDKRGADLISDALPFGRLWYEDASVAVDYAKHSSRSHDALIRVYDGAGNLIETHEHAGDFNEVVAQFLFTIKRNTRLSSAFPARNVLTLSDRMKVTGAVPGWGETEE